MRANNKDALDWRPAAHTLLADLDRELGIGPWTLVSSDGTRLLSAPDSAAEPSPAQHALRVPIALPDGSLLATLITRGAPDGLGPREAERLEAMSRVLEALLSAHEIAARAHRRAEQAEAEALTDTLTGLLNRRGWRMTARAEEARSNRTGSSVLVAVVDLDGLKSLNDLQGHLAGDVLLRLTGETLRGAVRTEDVVARAGGDEFHVMAVDYKPPTPAALTQRLRMELDAAEIPASIGTALREASESIEETLHRADKAMYEDKARRKGPARRV